MELNLKCPKCNYLAKSGHFYVKHTLIHEGDRRSKILCAYKSCKASFRYTCSLRKHMKCRHGLKKYSLCDTQDEELSYTSAYSSCYHQISNSLANLRTHLLDHCRRNERIVCPFRSCSNYYECNKKFLSHMQRTHRHCSIIDLKETEYYAATPVVQNSGTVDCASDVAAVDNYEENTENGS